MARPKAFDPDTAIDLAVQAFWSNGYEKTSLPKLMRETGVARQSLYDTFGDKRALYLKALERYRDTNHAMLRRSMRSGQPVLPSIAKILHGIATEDSASLKRGCLLLTANLERSADDQELQQFLHDNQVAVVKIFQEAFEHAQDTGEITNSADCAALARFLVSTIQGMRAMGRLQPNRKALEQVAQVALSALR